MDSHNNGAEPRLRPVPDQALAEIWSRAASGDPAALADLYDTTSPWVFGLALRMLGQESDAEEATLELYRDLYSRLAAGAGPRPNLASMLTGIRSHCLGRLRGGRAPAASILGTTSGAAAAWASMSLAQPTNPAIESLPPAHRCALEAAFFDGLGPDQVAARLDEDPTTVRSWIRTSLRDLARQLGGPVGESP